VKARLTALAGGAAITPALVLYGHTFIDSLDSSGFNVILPEIQESFDISLESVAALGSVTLLMGLLLSVPIAVRSERTQHRVAYLAAGAFVATFFSLIAGVAAGVALFTLARGGFGLGLRLNDPVQQSLLADYYPVHTRAAVFSGRELFRRVGTMLGPLVFGVVAQLFGWRAAVLGVAAPSLVLAFASLRLRNPKRGSPERAAMGIAEEEVEEDDPPTLEEAYAVLRRVGTVRRLWYLLPFLVGGLAALAIFLPLFADDVFDLDAGERGIVFTIGEAAAVLGLFASTPITAKYLRSPNPEKVFPLLAIQSLVAAACVLLIAVAPNLPVFLLGLVLLNFFGAIVTPASGVLLSLVVPPRVRTIGFAVGALWVLPGILMIPVLSAIGDSHGLRWGVAVAAPMFLIGGLISGSGGGRFVEDMRLAMVAASATIEDKRARDEGRAKLLVCRGIDLSYGQVQVLFGVDFDVEEGEMVALLGTNGAGKSSLLRAISGTALPNGGTILFDGKDVTSAAAARTAELGIVQVPGGKGVFPTMTVAENLRVASWLHRKDAEHLVPAVERALEMFPILRERADQPAGNLSGGEQQMLTLAQAFIAKPRLLLIDELSLGLAPTIVQQLLDMVRAIHAEGVTVVLVEQSVNVALTVCDRAVFMEKGEVRFQGPTADLLERPDVLRSVFLEGAGGGATSAPTTRARIDLEGLAEQGVRLPVLLEARGITKRFGGITAVDDVSFTLHQGEIVGLIGSNGAGKTTIFDLLSGFLSPDGGSVHLDGVEVTGWTAAQRSMARLGRSFQDARLFPSMTVHEAICVALERHLHVRSALAAVLWAPSAREEEADVRGRADELVTLMGLEAYRDKFVSELSTGTRRIVDLACVLAHEPKVLLLDEPSSGIAQRETEALGPLLLRIQEQLGCSLLIIEHDMPLITAVSDRLIALETGRVIARGAPDDVLGDPRVIASYLGTDQDVIARSGGSSAKRRRTRQLVAPGGDR
jgi:ABC-type branched-subunit amino acid transport system ATPase component/predicted MFS family arabinose efflux permease